MPIRSFDPSRWRTRGRDTTSPRRTRDLTAIERLSSMGRVPELCFEERRAAKTGDADDPHHSRRGPCVLRDMACFVDFRERASAMFL